MPSLPHRGCLPVRLQATLWWNPPNTLPICGFITHVLNPYKITDCTTAKYIWPEVWTFTPSLTITLISSTHFRCSFRKLLTTSGQSYSAAVRISPRYLKSVTGVRGIPYAVIAVSAPALASYSARRRRFLSAPLRQKTVVMYRLLRALRDTNM